MEQEKPVKETTKMVNDKKEQSEEKGMMTVNKSLLEKLELGLNTSSTTYKKMCPWLVYLALLTLVPKTIKKW